VCVLDAAREHGPGGAPAGPEGRSSPAAAHPLAWRRRTGRARRATRGRAGARAVGAARRGEQQERGGGGGRARGGTGAGRSRAAQPSRRAAGGAPAGRPAGRAGALRGRRGAGGGGSGPLGRVLRRERPRRAMAQGRRARRRSPHPTARGLGASRPGPSREGCGADGARGWLGVVRRWQDLGCGCLVGGWVFPREVKGQAGAGVAGLGCGAAGARGGPRCCGGGACWPAGPAEQAPPPHLGPPGARCVLARCC
jgi:hypothetical protein